MLIVVLVLEILDIDSSWAVDCVQVDQIYDWDPLVVEQDYIVDCCILYLCLEIQVDYIVYFPELDLSLHLKYDLICFNHMIACI